MNDKEKEFLEDGSLFQPDVPKEVRVANLIKYSEAYLFLFYDIIKKFNLSIGKGVGQPFYNTVQILDNDGFDVYKRYSSKIDAFNKNPERKFDLDVSLVELDVKSYVRIAILKAKKTD